MPYLEGWFVEAPLRQRGIGQKLLAAVEAWAKGQGFVELASDVYLNNTVSLSAHRALGFEPTRQIQHLKKKL